MSILAWIILVPLMAFGLAILLGVVKMPQAPTDPEPATLLAEMDELHRSVDGLKATIREGNETFWRRLIGWVRGGAW